MSSHGAPPTSSTLAFLFTDIEGSTARWEHQREAMAIALVRHDELLRMAIEARGGHVFKTVGDAFCAVFADPEAALGAAADAQRALAAQDWSAFGADFSELRVRMGIHYGRAEERGGDFFGPALNRTARLMSAGHGGQVLLSLAAQLIVREHLADGLDLRDLGEHRLKDLRQSEHIFQLVAEGLADVVKPPVTAEALTALDRVQVLEDAPARPLPEAMAALLAAIQSDDDPGGRDAAGPDRTVSLSPEQAREIAQRRPADLTAYRLGRIAEWSQPRYRLDGRFVALTLLVDQGEEAVGGRWAANETRHDDLGALLAAVSDPAIVVLGPPGAGKSTLLRHLELDLAIAALRGEGAVVTDGEADSGQADGARETLTLFIQLNQYKARAGQSLADPGDWLATEWSERYPDLPALDALLSEGRMVLLLDALNEMPAASERAYRERVGRWKNWLIRLAQTRPGNRVVFSCRSLDYSAPLSTPALRVPQVQIEPLMDALVEAFLQTYSPVRGAEIWKAIAGTPQLEALRAPYFLALVVEQVEATGDLAENRAGIFTGFVRQALRREVERDNPLFALEALLSSRDLRRITQWQWKDAYELPERGALFPKLGSLAYGMQEGAADGGASQVRLDLDGAMDLLDSTADEDIVKAGLAIAVLDEDPAADELLFRHQLLQEYFAARILARHPEPDLVASSSRAADVSPTMPELLATLSPADALSPLPQTGWEETTVLAAAMAEDKEAFVRGLMPASLTVAGRAAAAPAVRERLSAGFLDELRWALVARSRDRDADLRARIAAGLALGDLGDPRFERLVGPHGEYLLPPLIPIPGGVHMIGDDAPISYDSRGTAYTTAAHVPAHPLEVGPFQVGQFPVTRAEWACFMKAEGYEDDRWWDTEDGRRWRRGELANEGGKANSRYFRKRLLMEEGLYERMEIEGGFPNAAAAERWKLWMTLDDAAFEEAVDAFWRATRQVEPLFWHDARLNTASQPVVGICWYEARAYCCWLSAQTGLRIALPTEVEWEVAARGAEGRRYPWGNDWDALRANSFDSHLRRTSPIGAFVTGDSPEGVADLAGNVFEWTSSLFGAGELDDQSPAFAYPYHPADGREHAEAPSTVRRVLRGGSWSADPVNARAVYRLHYLPDFRGLSLGIRLRVAVEVP